MNDALHVALAGLAGLLIGAMFFGGLWWTITRGVASPCPARWFVGSLLLRTGAALAGFSLVGWGHGERLLACLLGFLAARLFLTLRLRTRLRPSASLAQSGPVPLARLPADQGPQQAREGRHAP